MHLNPSGLPSYSRFTHTTDTHVFPPPSPTPTPTHSHLHPPLSFLLQLCELVQPSESLLLFALVLPRLRGDVASKLPVFEFLQSLLE